MPDKETAIKSQWTIRANLVLKNEPAKTIEQLEVTYPKTKEGLDNLIKYCEECGYKVVRNRKAEAIKEENKDIDYSAFRNNPVLNAFANLILTRSKLANRIKEYEEELDRMKKQKEELDIKLRPIDEVLNKTE